MSGNSELLVKTKKVEAVNDSEKFVYEICSIHEPLLHDIARPENDYYEREGLEDSPVPF